MYNAAGKRLRNSAKEVIIPRHLKRAAAHHNLGAALRAKGDLPGAIAACQKAIEVDPKDGTALIEICYARKLHGAAGRFAAEIFAADPEPADNLKTSLRYNAACSAALAGSGQGEDAAQLDEPERARWRKQAVTWLRADLALWAKHLESGKPEDRTQVRQKLQHWQKDADLASLRDAAGLARLPADEQAECRKLWDEVAALLEKAAEQP